MKAKRILSIILALILTLSAIPFGGMISSFAKTIEEYSVGDIIEFGSYPQSKVTDEALLEELEKITPDYSIWISYGYYSGTGDWDDGQMTAKDYMKYADISYGGNKYRAVKFTSYRPYSTGHTCSADNSNQDDNSYYTNTVYYFKFEPLKWRILDPAEGYVMCESIIDSQAFNNYIYYIDYYDEFYGNSSCTYYSCDYANSSIRQWLNNDFYNTAFSSSEKSKIVTAEYENKSTFDSWYDSATTYDKITLLSYWDAVNSNYGFSSSDETYDTARKAQGTDYAKCQGLWVNTGSSYNGNSNWPLRSPHFSYYLRYVDYEGNVNYYYYSTDYTGSGVRPAFKFDPKSIIIDVSKRIEDYSVGDIIEFGSYPQSKVTYESLLEELEKITPDYSTWISYGYYSGTGDSADGQMTAKDYMKYADISYGGNKYRAVKFTSYRPDRTGHTSSSSYTCQNDNGYYTNNVYYFKFEPLKWRILDPAEGYVMCESTIDSQAFNNYIYYNGGYYGNSSCTYYASDYANSSIRQWLNNDFYNTAFSSSEKSKIVTAEYENKSTDSSIYDSATTYDKITLLSYWDAVNRNYGFSSSYETYDTARRARGTDYAKCQGLFVITDSSYNGNSCWRLRSPYYSIFTRYVNYDGCVYYNDNTDYTYYGVRPAFKFNPKSIIPDCEHLNTEHKVEPSTCTEKGAEYDFCKDCKYAINYVELPLAAHTPGNWEQTVAPKCTTKGKQIKKCTVCKEIVETQEISATGHTPGEWKVTIEPTRDTEGARANYCAICREFIKTEIIPKLNDLVSLSLPKDFEVNYKTSKNLSPKIDAKSYDYTVSYTSSNEAVATVDGKGNVKGISTGEATITCTVTDKYGNTLTDSTNVTVSLAWWQWLIKILLFGWIWY